MERLFVIKIGGNVIDNSKNLYLFLENFSSLEGHKVLVHGGGKIATKLAADLGIESKLVDGRRVTDLETLQVVTMVYAGLINKNIVAQLQAHGCNAIGLSGADGNFIRAQKRPVKEIDYGFVGDIHEGSVAAHSLSKLIEGGFTPVFSPITHDGQTQLLNTNADTIASALAVAFSGIYQTSLIYCFEKKGVLRDVMDENSVIPLIDQESYYGLKADGTITEGMIPKLDNAFNAINNGVDSVIIGDAGDLNLLQSTGNFGTKLIA
ncbi:MAG TPA: acetylglutamate kinase [Sphingobacteriaceae bacterium]|nr:acetylglutamate kinase [Sphingobacteriaceae bacterium]